MEALSINGVPNQKLDETEIIKRILRGEKELYEMLVRRNNQKLYRIIRTYLKVEAEVEDVMQNSYVKAYANLDKFKLNATFSTWLVRIAINESLARLKSKNSILQYRSSENDIDNPIIFNIPDRGELNPQEKMIRKEAKQLLENAIDRLDLKYREVYMMSEVEEMSMKEIAGALDLTVSNVKVRLHRAKVMLKDNLFEISAGREGALFEFGFSRCDRITENVMSRI